MEAQNEGQQPQLRWNQLSQASQLHMLALMRRRLKHLSESAKGGGETDRGIPPHQQDLLSDVSGFSYRSLVQPQPVQEFTQLLLSSPAPDPAPPEDEVAPVDQDLLSKRDELLERVQKATETLEDYRRTVPELVDQLPIANGFDSTGDAEEYAARQVLFEEEAQKLHDQHAQALQMKLSRLMAVRRQIEERKEGLEEQLRSNLQSLEELEKCCREQEQRPVSHFEKLLGQVPIAVSSSDRIPPND